MFFVFCFLFLLVNIKRKRNRMLTRFSYKEVEVFLVKVYVSKQENKRKQVVLSMLSLEPMLGFKNKPQPDPL